MISLPIFEDEKPEEVEVDLDLFPLHPADPLHLDVVAQVPLGEGNYSVPAGCVPAFKAGKKLTFCSSSVKAEQIWWLAAGIS